MAPRRVRQALAPVAPRRARKSSRSTSRSSSRRPTRRTTPRSPPGCARSRRSSGSRWSRRAAARSASSSRRRVLAAAARGLGSTTIDNPGGWLVGQPLVVTARDAANRVSATYPSLAAASVSAFLGQPVEAQGGWRARIGARTIPLDGEGLLMLLPFKTQEHLDIGNDAASGGPSARAGTSMQSAPFFQAISFADVAQARRRGAQSVRERQADRDRLDGAGAGRFRRDAQRPVSRRVREPAADGPADARQLRRARSGLARPRAHRAAAAADRVRRHAASRRRGRRDRFRRRGAVRAPRRGGVRLHPALDEPDPRGGGDAARRAVRGDSTARSPKAPTSA